MTVKNIFLGIVAFMFLAPSVFFFCNTNALWGDSKENQAPLEFNPKRPLDFFDTYYKNNFAFRKVLVNHYLSLNSSMLLISPIPDKVVYGKSGWYFLGDGYNNIYSESLGVFQETDSTITAVSNNVLEMKRFCDSVGVKFYFLMAPTSHTIYKEFLPIKPNNCPKTFDRIKSKLSGKMEVMDIRPNLIAAKKERQIYYRTDTHWNEYGAFVGAEELVKRIKTDLPETQLLHRENFNVIQIEQKQMDLTKMLGIYKKEIYYKFVEKQKSTFTERRDTINRLPEIFIKNPNRPYKGILFRDSYTVSLIPFLNITFGDLTYLSTPKFDKSRILKEKPDFVIYEITEKDLNLISFKE